MSEFFSSVKNSAADPPIINDIEYNATLLSRARLTTVESKVLFPDGASTTMPRRRDVVFPERFRRQRRCA